MDPKETEQKNNIPNGQALIEQERNAFYNKHSSVSVIVKKTEKITTAIYMVTDFVSESEPLRNKLRTLALSLSGDTRKISSRCAEPHYVLANEIILTADETLSLLALSSTIGLISEMNVRILTTELEKVKKDIEIHYGDKKVLITTHPGYANILLNPAMFEVSPSETFLPILNKRQDIDKGQQLETDVLNKNEIKSPFKTDSFNKKNDIGIKIARRNDVLNVVRIKGKVSIKDIVSILKDISEKTVQRELHALVAEGALIKEGEKRWSMYRIAS